MYFVLLVIEKNTGLIYKSGKLISVFRWLYTFFFVVIGWIIFRSDSLQDAVLYLKSVFGSNGNVFADGSFTGWFTQNLILLIIGAFFCTPAAWIFSEKRKDSIIFKVMKMIILAILFVLSVASLVSNSYNPFIYFNF